MNEKNPRVDFVIVGWNNKTLLRDCFESIISQSYQSVNIIYVDNASSDGSVEWVQKNYPKVEVINLDKNTGFAKGNNSGIAVALEDSEVEFVALLNTDARLDPDWVKTIVDFAAHKPKGACYQGTTLDYYHHGIIDSTHIFSSHNGQGTQGNWRHYLVHELGPRKVFGVNAAAAMISRRFIESQPFGKFLFDESMYMYLEDVDLAARSTVMGWDNYLVPGARAYHMGSISAKNKSSTFSLYMTFRNNSAMLYKNFNWYLLLRIFPKLLRGDIDTMITLWHTERRTYIWAVIRGRILGILRLPMFARKRAQVNRVRQIDSEYLWHLMQEGY